MSRAEIMQQWGEITRNQTIARMFAISAAETILKRCDPDRMLRMAKMRSEGKTLNQIGKAVGLSTTYTRVLLIRYEREMSKFMVFR